jgi:hypothetical protein
MKTVISSLKIEVCARALACQKLRGVIRSLKWKDGVLPEVKKIRSQRDASGRRIAGKKALRDFRRPETGPERSQLWVNKQEESHYARCALLAYGMLRGRAYKTMESSVRDGNGVNCYGVRDALNRALPSDKHVTIKQIQEWISGESVQIFEVAA